MAKFNVGDSVMAEMNSVLKSNEMKSDKTIMSVLTEAERQQLISIMKKVIRAAEKY